ncbi:MAG: hypothetical protein U1E23_13415 [Reyranellaceae bacterium]
MKCSTAALLGVLAAGIVGPAAAEPAMPFHGVWQCRQVVDGLVADGAWRETYGPEGLSVADSGRPAERFATASTGPNAWRLSLVNGAVLILSMPAPYVLLRATLDHAYVCLRIAS